MKDYMCSSGVPLDWVLQLASASWACFSGSSGWTPDFWSGGPGFESQLGICNGAETFYSVTYACCYQWTVVNICLPRICWKILALFCAQSHDQKCIWWPLMFCTSIKRILWCKQKVSIFEIGWDMAIHNFQDITWPEVYWLSPNFKFFIRNIFYMKWIFQIKVHTQNPYLWIM